MTLHQNFPCHIKVRTMWPKSKSSFKTRLLACEGDRPRREAKLSELSSAVNLQLQWKSRDTAASDTYLKWE